MLKPAISPHATACLPNSRSLLYGLLVVDSQRHERQTRRPSDQRHLRPPASGNMSIIRILLGVIVGGCIVAGLLAAAVRFPALAGFVFFGSAGAFILWVAYDGLRTGVIGAKRSRYERSSCAWGFWFYISFYTLLGTVVLGYGVYCVLHPMIAGQ